MSRMAEQVIFVMVPPLALIFLVLGTIFIGLATPTEGGAMGALGALILAAVKRRLDTTRPVQLRRSSGRRSSRRPSSRPSCSSSWSARACSRSPSTASTATTGSSTCWPRCPAARSASSIFVNVLVFLLAFFLDFFELAFIIIPLLGPAAEKLGIDLIWFGVMLGVNMQTSFMHPPFGFALFYLRSVAPQEPYIDKVTGKRMEPVTTGQIYWGAVPFVVIQCIMVGARDRVPADGDALQESTGATVDPKAVEKNLRRSSSPGSTARVLLRPDLGQAAEDP